MGGERRSNEVLIRKPSKDGPNQAICRQSKEYDKDGEKWIWNGFISDRADLSVIWESWLNKYTGVESILKRMYGWQQSARRNIDCFLKTFGSHNMWEKYWLAQGNRRK